MGKLIQKISLLLITLLLLILFLPTPTLAHPLDVSYIDIFTQKDKDNQPLPDNQLQAIIFLSWPEALLLKERHQSTTSPTQKLLTTALSSPSAQLLPETLNADPNNIINQLTSSPDPFINYLKTKLIIYNNQTVCQLQFQSFADLPEQEIFFGRGIGINTDFTCNQPLNQLQILNHIFVDEFEAQINLINIYANPSKIIKGAILTPTNPELALNLYQPLSSSGIIKPKSPTPSNFISKISQAFINYYQNSLLLALAIAFLLGLFHTLEAGHSKAILASYLLNQAINFKKALIYVIAFTLTHIADILILGIIFLIVDSFVDIFSKLNLLQAFSLYALLFISLYLFFHHLAHLVKHKLSPKHQHHHHPQPHLPKTKKSSFKNQLIMGFVTGLSPCLMGWSIFMIVLSTKKIWTIFPIILAFGLGIFTALMLIALLTIKLKFKLFKKYPWIGTLSPLISSLMLIFFALLLII